MQSPLSKIMFLDIETVPLTESLSDLPDDLQHLWEEKFRTLQRTSPGKYGSEMSASEAYESNAAIYSEYGRIVCISVGFIFYQNQTMHFRTKSFADEDEKALLKAFSELIDKFFTSSEHQFCGHNIKEFDIPFICRRMIIQHLPLPKVLQINSKKPWETNLLDTLDFWKFGDYKNYTSLKLLTAILGIPTPKDDIDGSQVATVYYKENNLKRISTYCEKDVIATAQVWLRLNGLDAFDYDSIQHAD